MRNTPQAPRASENDPGVTLTLTEDQFHAIGLSKLPAAGAEVHIRATATVTHPDDADHGRELEHKRDTDHDAAIDAHGGDMDSDDGAETGDHEDQANAQSDAGETTAPALTLRLSGLTLIPVHRTPDKVLYGGGR